MCISIAMFQCQSTVNGAVFVYKQQHATDALNRVVHAFQFCINLFIIVGYSYTTIQKFNTHFSYVFSIS